MLGEGTQRRRAVHEEEILLGYRRIRCIFNHSAVAPDVTVGLCERLATSKRGTPISLFLFSSLAAQWTSNTMNHRFGRSRYDILQPPGKKNPITMCTSCNFIRHAKGPLRCTCGDAHYVNETSVAQTTWRSSQTQSNTQSFLLALKLTVILYYYYLYPIHEIMVVLSLSLKTFRHLMSFLVKIIAFFFLNCRLGIFTQIANIKATFYWVYPKCLCPANTFH